jgi:hypothetical protein
MPSPLLTSSYPRLRGLIRSGRVAPPDAKISIATGLVDQSTRLRRFPGSLGKRLSPGTARTARHQRWLISDRKAVATTAGSTV